MFRHEDMLYRLALGPADMLLLVHQETHLIVLLTEQVHSVLH